VGGSIVLSRHGFSADEHGARTAGNLARQLLAFAVVAHHRCCPLVDEYLAYAEGHDFPANMGAAPRRKGLCAYLPVIVSRCGFCKHGRLI
jgi:hypothetical protein